MARRRPADIGRLAIVRTGRAAAVLGTVALVLGFGLALTACLGVGISADEAARIAFEDARSVEHWRIERVGLIREAGPAELADAPDVDARGGTKIWLVPLFGLLGVACHAGGCDLAGDSVRIFVDATSGNVLGREVRNVR